MTGDEFKELIEKIPNSGCWIWMGFVEKSNGYGKAYLLGRTRGAHRCSWMLHRGEIPPGMQVLHKCDVRCCVNPDHLYLGTDTENVRDMVVRKRNKPFSAKGSAHPRAILDEATVAKIRSMYVPRKMGYRKLASMFNMSIQSIRNINQRVSWKHV